MADPAQQVTPTPSPGITQMQGDIARDEKLYESRVGSLTDEQRRISTEREKNLAPLEQEISKRLAEPYPERPHTELPTFKPKPVIDAKDYEALSYGLIAMAMIGGAASKGQWLEVGASLNGALKGYLEGNKMVAEKRYADYEQSFRDAQAKEAQANREFEDILKNKQLRISDQINQYRIVAAKYDRQDAIVAAQSRSLDQMWRSLESRKTALARLEESHDRAQEAIQLRREIAKRNEPTAGLSEKYKTDPQYKANVDYWAKVVQSGVALPPRFAQSGAGKMMMPDIINVVPSLGTGNPGEMVAGKLNQREMMAEAQKIGTQSASVAIANAELQRFIPPAEKAIDNVARLPWTPLNKLIQAGAKTWSPEQKDLVVRDRAVKNAFAQIIQRGAPTVHSLSEAEAMLDTAESPAVYKQALRSLSDEGVKAEEGLKDVSDALQKRAKEMGAPSPSAAPSQKNPTNLTPPSGVAADVWQHMTDDERALWGKT